MIQYKSIFSIFKSLSRKTELQTNSQSRWERAPTATAGRSLKSLAQNTATARKAAEQKGAWQQNRWHLGAFTEEQGKPTACALPAGRSGPSTSGWAERPQTRQQDFQRVEPLPCRERPKQGCLVGRGGGGVDIAEVYKATLNWMGNCYSASCAMQGLRDTN